MLVAAATTKYPEWPYDSPYATHVHPMLIWTSDRVYNASCTPVSDAYHLLYLRNQHHDFICYMHDDAEIHEPLWAERVTEEFAQNPEVAIVGFGGAMGIGVSDIYKSRYELNQLRRIDYYSNQRDWRVHGKRETGSRQVIVVDGFFMAMRVEFLKQVGGWSWFPFAFHCYDTCACLMAYQHGWKVRMVGVDCTHHGGGTSTKKEYADWCREHNTTIELEHSRPHKWMYEEFRDLLPLRIT